MKQKPDDELLLNQPLKVDPKDFDKAICSCGCRIFMTVKLDCRFVPATYSQSGKLGQVMCQEMDVCIACHKPLHITSLEYVKQKEAEANVQEEVKSEILKINKS
jgi:hypothetical protein